MIDPFGIQQQKIVLSAIKDSDNVVKKEKKVDMVKIYLAAIPSLETAKNDLEAVMEGIQNEEIKTKIEGFIASILQITEEVLDLTKVAIRGEKEVVKGVTPDNKAITPEMISGKPPVAATPQN